MTPTVTSAEIIARSATKTPIYSGAIGRFPLALRAVAETSEYGRVKYNLPPCDKDFLLDPDGFNHHTEALCRHLLDEQTEGARNAKDGGLRHAAQVAFNALARLEILLRSEIVGDLLADDPRRNVPALGCPDNGDCVGCTDNCVSANARAGRGPKPSNWFEEHVEARKRKEKLTAPKGRAKKGRRN